MSYIDTINDLEEWKLDELIAGDRVKTSKIQRLIDRLFLRRYGKI